VWIVLFKLIVGENYAAKQGTILLR